MSCSVCNMRIKRDCTMSINCGSCNESFHSSCVNLQEYDMDYMKFNKKVWNCSLCVDKLKSHRTNDDCPATPSKPIESNTLEKICSDLSEMKSIFTAHNLNIEKKLDWLKHSVDKIDTLIKENIALKNKVCSMELKIDYLEQIAQQNAIEVHGIPISPNENTEDVVIDILKKGIDYTVNKADIDYCYRKINKNKSPTAQTCPPVYIKFTRRTVKHDIMYAKTKQKFDVTKAGFPIGSRIYINESLSSSKRKLFYDAKNLKLQLKFKYVWIRNGNIFMRQSEGSELYKVNCSNDLEKITDKYK